MWKLPRFASPGKIIRPPGRALKYYKKSGNIGEVICLEMLFEEDKINDFQNQIIKFLRNKKNDKDVKLVKQFIKHSKTIDNLWKNA